MAVVTDGFERRGEFWYRVGAKGRNPHDQRECEGCGHLRLIRRGSRFCSLSCAASQVGVWHYPGRTPPVKRGAESHNWVGDQAGYVARHQRVYQIRGKADRCVWGCQANRYNWANMTGDVLNPDDYAPMCQRCHRRFDAAVLMTAERDGNNWRPWRGVRAVGRAEPAVE
jgi:hypothetical protein